MVDRVPEGPVFVGNRQPAPQNLADVLERVLDKGIVIVGDIQVRLLDIELLTIKVRLMVASVDRAKDMGIDWWENDPFVSSLAKDEQPELEERLRALEERVDGSGGSREQ
jgi:hypothetical protein